MLERLPVASDRLWIHGGVRVVWALVVGSDFVVFFIFAVFMVLVLFLTVAFQWRALV